MVHELDPKLIAMVTKLYPYREANIKSLDLNKQRKAELEKKNNLSNYDKYELDQLSKTIDVQTINCKNQVETAKLFLTESSFIPLFSIGINIPVLIQIIININIIEIFSYLIYVCLTGDFYGIL